MLVLVAGGAKRDVLNTLQLSLSEGKFKMKFSKIVTFRWLTKAFFIFILLVSPLFQVIRTFWQDPYPYIQSPLTQYPALQAYLVEHATGWREMFGVSLVNVSGGPYSLRIFGIHFVEPLTAFISSINHLVSFQALNLTALISFMLPLLVALVFGRIYCGYICPMSTLVALNLKMQKFLFGREPSYSGSHSKGSSSVRLLILTVISILLIFNPFVLQYILPASLMQHAVSDVVLYGGMSIWLIILSGLLVIELAAPAFFCRKLCPTGFFSNSYESL
jgi:polyferredoxin